MGFTAFSKWKKHMFAYVASVFHIFLILFDVFNY